MPFRRTAKPESSVYRHFIYLDSEEILNALSCFEGGGIEERTQKIVTDAGGGIDLALPTAVGNIGLHGKAGRTVEREIRRKRTAYSAVTDLLQRLRESKDLKSLDRESRTELDENDLVEFSGDIALVPSAQSRESRPATALARLWSWLTQAGVDRKGHRYDLGFPEFVTVRATMGSTGRQGLMRLRTDYLVIRRPDELRRSISVVGQIEALSDGGEVLAVRPTRLGWELETSPPGLPPSWTATPTHSGDDARKEEVELNPRTVGACARHLYLQVARSAPRYNRTEVPGRRPYLVAMRLEP